MAVVGSRRRLQRVRRGSYMQSPTDLRSTRKFERTRTPKSRRGARTGINVCGAPASQSSRFQNRLLQPVRAHNVELAVERHARAFAAASFVIRMMLSKSVIA